MPSTRQFRSIGLLTVLAFCIIYYIYNGASDTHESEFYQRTKAALERKKTSHDRDQIFAEEKDRLGRVERLRKEHDAAVEKEGATKVSTSHSEAAVTQVVGGEERIKGQKPLKVPDTEKDGKVVHGAPKKDSDDGVAKIGNVRQQQQSLHKEGGAVTEGEDDDEDAAAKRKKKQEEAEVEAELTDILKKGPIIVFSKSYCPYSKKAKVCGMECRMNVCMLTLAFFSLFLLQHVLLDLYSITPAPYVVELDTHPLGPGLQSHLYKSTGRRTVPNVLINGRSIGGGDDIVGLHESGKLIDTITSMGGKRIMSASKKEPHAKRFNP